MVVEEIEKKTKSVDDETDSDFDSIFGSDCKDDVDDNVRSVAIK